MDRSGNEGGRYIAVTGNHVLEEQAPNKLCQCYRRASCGTILLISHFWHVGPTTTKFWAQEFVYCFEVARWSYCNCGLFKKVRANDPKLSNITPHSFIFELWRGFWCSSRWFFDAQYLQFCFFTFPLTWVTIFSPSSKSSLNIFLPHTKSERND